MDSPTSVVTATWLGLLVACGPGAESAQRGAPSREGGSLASAQGQAASAAPTARVAGASAPALAPAAATRGAAPGTASERLRFGGRGPEHDFVVEHLARAQPLSFKPVSATGTVMRVRLAAPFDAAFKPVTAVRPLGPQAEVSAYRLARCLLLDNVPPAISRDFAGDDIRAALDPEFRPGWRALRERLGVGDRDRVRGAAIFWINELVTVGLEKRDGLRRAGEWLRIGGEIPEASRSLAASVSSMLAFDYLIGNFDRWSGGNVLGDARATRVYVRDHDLAFPARMTEQLHRRLWEDLHHAERFSRRFYAAVRALTPERFARELASDPEGARGRLLSARQLRGVFDRHEALISYVESLIDLHGEQAVLTFE